MTVAEVEVIVGADVKPLEKGMSQAVDVSAKTTKTLDGDTKLIAKSVEGLRGSFVAMATGIQRENREAADSLRTELKGSLEEVKQELQEVAKEAKRSMKTAADAADDPAKKLKATAETLNQFGEQSHRVGLTLSAALTAPLVLAAKEGVSLAGDFEQSMNVLKVSASATDAQMKRLSDTAKKLGDDASLPGTSSVDAAHAMLELNKAGLSVNDTLGAARGVLEMSAAGQLDNAKAATIAANALNSFGLKGTEATRVSDLLAAAANASSASVESLADGLSQSSSVYASAGLKIENLTAALAMMANKGIQGSDAGTSLKTMLMALEAPAKESTEQMGKWGIRIYDAQGKMVAFRGIIAQFEKATKGLTQQERDHGLATIFGTDAVRAANVVFGQGVKAYDSMEKAVTKAGAGAQMAAAMNAGFKGSLDAATSAGQTMLQGFLEPTLPVLTNFFQSTSRVLSVVGDWPPASKAVAVGLGVVLAATGPVIVATGTLASSISGIIGLRAMYLQATGAQAAGNSGLAASATAAAGAQTAEAGAIDATAVSARAATGSVVALTAATLALAAIAATAIVITVKAVYDYSAAQGQASASAERAASFAYGPDDWIQAQRRKGDKRSKGDLYKAFKSTPYYEPFMHSGPNGANRDANVAAFNRRQVDAKGAADAAQKQVDDALARMKTVMPKVKGSRGGGGGHGKSAEEKAEAKAVADQRSEYKSLTDQLYEAQKAKALLGKTSEALSLAYDIQHGKINAVNAAHAREVVGALKSKEALEASTEAQAKAKEAATQYAKDRQQHWAAMAMQQVGVNAQDAKALELFGKHFGNLTSEENKKRVLWALDEDRAKAAKDLYDSGQQYAKDALADLQHEIDIKSVLTRVDQARLDIAERRKKGETISADQENGILAAAGKLDAADWSKELTDFGDALQANIDAVVSKAKEAKESAKEAALSRYSDAIAQLRERMTMTGTETAKVQAQTIRLAESYGVGATAADRIRNGMSRAKEVMDLTLQAERTEAWKQEIRDLASTGADAFARMATGMTDGFSLSFKGILSGFSSMIAQMTQQWAQAQVTKGATSLLTGLLGSAFGSGSGGAAHDWYGPFDGGVKVKGRATGGPVLKGVPYKVGEHGPELFVPSGNGSIANAKQTRGMSGATVHVTMNVTTPDAGSFKDSDRHMAMQLGRKIQHAMNTIG